MLILREPFSSLWKDKNPFDEVEKISGQVFRELETRRTLRFEVDGERFFLKLHHGIQFKEVLKSWIRFRAPVMGADREWVAIHRLAECGVDTMEGVAYGFQEEGNPLKRASFIITKDLGNTINIHDFLCAPLKPSPSVKRLVIRRMAQMVRRMHDCGINHRDCYLAHFLLSRPFDVIYGKDENLKISIIDLHRAQVRNKVPTRWRDKDLIGLLFSARELKEVSFRDVYRFMKEYFQMPLREVLRTESALVGSAKKRIARMEHHQENLKKKRRV